MRYFDTHCHFETAARAEIAAVLSRAQAAGVDRVLAVGGSSALNAAALVAGELGALVAFGYDRDQTECERPPIPLGLKGVVAVGEIGLDYHYSAETRSAQLELFAAELERARALDLPVIVHTREADEDTLAVLREVPSRGIIHSFTGTPEFAARLLELGFYISFSGIVTFKSAANVRLAALAVPLDRLLAETDSPYLAPVPLRGQRNEPAFVRHTVAFLARELGIEEERFAEIVYENSLRALNIRRG